MFPLVAVLSRLSGRILTWMSEVLLTLLPALSGSPLWEVTRSPFAATCHDRIAPVVALSPHASPKCAPSCGLGGTSNFCWRLGPFGFNLSGHRFFGSGSGCGSGCGYVNTFQLWPVEAKKQHLCLLEVILPCFARIPSPA